MVLPPVKVRTWMLMCVRILTSVVMFYMTLHSVIVDADADWSILAMSLENYRILCLLCPLMQVHDYQLCFSEYTQCRHTGRHEKADRELS